MSKLNPHPAAIRAAEKIVQDLNDRSGFEIDGVVSPETSQEIRKAFQTIISREYEPVVESLDSALGLFESDSPLAHQRAIELVKKALQQLNSN